MSYDRPTCIPMIDLHALLVIIDHGAYGHIGCRTYENLGLRMYSHIERCTYSNIGSRVYGHTAWRTYANIGRRTYTNRGIRTYDYIGGRNCRNVGRRVYGHIGRRTYENFGELPAARVDPMSEDRSVFACGSSMCMHKKLICFCIRIVSVVV